MDRYVVACVQQRLRVPLTAADHREQVSRFVRVAANKRARLVVFPELAGLMVVPPLLRDRRSTLLKRAEQGRRQRASIWQRIVGNVAGGVATLVKASLQTSLAGLLDVAAPTLWSAYQALYGDLAREFGVTIVAPSIYAPDPLDGVIRNLAAVFGSGGELLGVQAKVMLSKADLPFAQPGATWDVIRTEVGALGIMIGNDVLYPEVGRLLAFQGAEALVMLAACTSVTHYNKLRAATLVRMQDNQLFAASSYVVGANPYNADQATPFAGRAAVFGPQELSPRQNGVLIEMGNQQSEGVLTAEWDFVLLKRLWETSETPVRQTLPIAQAGQMLAALYQSLQSLPRLAADTGDEITTGEEETPGDSTPPAQPAPSEEPRRDAPLLHLDELVVVASVTSRWPLTVAGGLAEPEEEMVTGWSANMPPDEGGAVAAQSDQPAVEFEEETDEMDAL